MRRLVLFDLDGTITRHDTLVPYVFRFLRRRPWRFLSLVAMLPSLVRFVLRRADHGDVKAALLRSTLRGRSRAELARWTGEYVAHVIEHGCYPRALEVIAQHRREGDRLVLMSASPDLYVPELGRRLGFDEVLCTGVRWNGERLDGALTTANCRGEEKARCVRRLRAEHPGMSIVAYANGPADLPHLRIVDRPLLVNALAVTRKVAEKHGIPVDSWK